MLKKLRLHPLFAPDGDPPGTPPTPPADPPPADPPPADPPPADPPPVPPPAEFKPEEWRNLLPEDLRGNPVIRDLNTPEAVVNSLVEAQGMIGSSIRVPSQEASAEDVEVFHNQLMEKVPGLMLKPDLADSEARDKIYDQLGRPAKPEEYQVPDIDTGGIKIDHSLTEAFRPLAHKAGLNQAQFELIVKSVSEQNIETAKQQRQAHDASMLELSKEWGVLYDDRVREATNYAQQSGAPAALVAALQSNAVDAGTVKWLYEQSQATPAEGAGINRDQNNRDQRMTSVEAKNRIQEIYRNKDHAFWNPEDPDHHDALNLMIELRKMADPSASRDLSDLRATGRANE